MKTYLDAIRTFVKIAELAQRAHNDPHFHDDPNIKLSIYREARELAVPWLWKAEDQLRQHGLLENHDNPTQSLAGKQPKTGLLAAIGSLATVLLSGREMNDSEGKEGSEGMSSAELKLLKEMHGLMRMFLGLVEGKIAKYETSIGGDEIEKPKDGQKVNSHLRKHAQESQPSLKGYAAHDDRNDDAAAKGTAVPSLARASGNKRLSKLPKVFTSSAGPAKRLSPAMHERYAHWPGGAYWTIYDPSKPPSRPEAGNAPTLESGQAPVDQQRPRDSQEYQLHRRDNRLRSGTIGRPRAQDEQRAPPSTTSARDFALPIAQHREDMLDARLSNRPSTTKSRAPLRSGATHCDIQQVEPVSNALQDHGAEYGRSNPMAASNLANDGQVFQQHQSQQTSPRRSSALSQRHNSTRGAHHGATLQHSAGETAAPEAAHTSEQHGNAMNPATVQPGVFGTTPETNPHYAWRPPATVGLSSEAGSRRSRITLAPTISSKAVSARTSVPQVLENEAKVPSRASASQRFRNTGPPSQVPSQATGKTDKLSDIEQAVKESMKTYAQSVDSGKSRSIHDSGYHTAFEHPVNAAVAPGQASTSNKGTHSSRESNIGIQPEHTRSREHRPGVAPSTQNARPPSVYVTAHSDETVPSVRLAGPGRRQTSSRKSNTSHSSRHVRPPMAETAFVPPLADAANTQSSNKQSKAEPATIRDQTGAEVHSEAGSRVPSAASSRPRSLKTPGPTPPGFRDDTHPTAPTATPETEHCPAPRSSRSESMQSRRATHASRLSSARKDHPSMPYRAEPARESAVPGLHQHAAPFETGIGPGDSISGGGRTSSRASSRAPVSSAVHDHETKPAPMASVPEANEAAGLQQQGGASTTEDGVSVIDMFEDYSKAARPKRCHHLEEDKPSCCPSEADTRDMQSMAGGEV